jgi:hypothetical protein
MACRWNDCSMFQAAYQGQWIFLTVTGGGRKFPDARNDRKFHRFRDAISAVLAS